MIKNLIKKNEKCPSALLCWKHTGIFKDTREMHREERGTAEVLMDFSVFLTILNCLYNSTMLE